MDVTARCRSCGLTFPVRGLVGGTGDLTLVGCATSCPRCGGPADIRSGTYYYVENVVRAFTAPGVTFERVSRFRDVAEQVQAGALTKEQATKQIGELGSALVALWKWTNDNGAALTVLLTIIAIYLALQSSSSADVAAGQQLKATRTQTQVQEKILEELQKRPEAAKEMEAQSAPTRSKRAESQPQMQVKATSPNRHERRARKARDRRGPTS